MIGDDFKVTKRSEVRAKKPGFTNKGKYDLSRLDVEDVKALLAMRLMQRQPLADLMVLLRTHYQSDFPDLEEEITEESLRLMIQEHYIQMNS